MAAACAGAAENISSSVPTFWRYAHPDARMLVGVDVGRIASSAVGQRVKREIAQIGIKAAISGSGFGFLQDIQRVLISSTGELTDSKPGKQPPAVIAIQGKFDVTALRAEMTRKKAAKFVYKNAEIFRRGSNNDMVVAVVSGNVLLVGDGPSLKLAIDNHAEADPEFIESSLVRRAVELDGLYEVWFASEVSPVTVAESAGAPTGRMKFFADTNGFEGGISFRKGLGLELAIHNNNEEAAAKLASAMRLAMDLVPADDKQSADLLRKVVVSNDASSVHVSFAYDEKEVMAGIDTVIASRLKGPMLTAKAGQSPQSAERPLPRQVALAAEPIAADAKPMVVRILNADGGTREVVLR
jgi:hypothetical protein